ncbi:MAG: hypothetical protein V3T20_00390 [Gemmatimonadota bacterium]
MRLSSARLVNSSIRLAELRFPGGRVHVPRTRLAFIHLDNLLHFAKADRDGKVDGYVAAYLPDEVVLLLLRMGELANAVAITQVGRVVLPMPVALRQIRQQHERGELVYCDAPFEQLVWMYQSCAESGQQQSVDAQEPEKLFPTLQHERLTGVVELISDGRVNYVRMEAGEFVEAHFCDKPDEMSVARYMEGLFAHRADGTPPEVAATVLPLADDFPQQAASELIQTYRELFWAVAAKVDEETSGAGMKHVYHFRDLLKKIHTPLDVIGVPLDEHTDEIVATAEELTFALSDWAAQVLEQVEIVAPGSAPTIVRDATREHRFVLQKAGFYDRLPWAVSW